MTDMKKYIYLFFAAVFVTMACVPQDPQVQFGVDSDNIEIGPAGGKRLINVSSADNWTAMVQEPWITVSPSNGRGSVECEVIIDSALAVTSRTGVVRINNLNTSDYKEFTITQKGFDYSIELKDTKVEIAEYAEYDKRSFDVVVNTNVDFEVVVPEEAQNWLKYKKSDLDLDRGARPRNSVVHFEWKVNTRDISRDALVSFKPVEEVVMTRSDVLEVHQKASVTIPANTVQGDSLALIAIRRNINSWEEYEVSERMEHWEGVTVWKSGPNKGRVRSASFALFDTKEELPYEVQYLTAAEELYFFGNSNSFLKDLDPGEYITTLTNLKRLTIGAYGLNTIPDSFKNLSNLEMLDLSANNFQKIPEIITPENFPNLRSLYLNTNTRRTIYDLKNTIYENYGGLVDETPADAEGKRTFPRRLLEWKQLDTIRLSVNYLHGEIPDMEDYPEKWTAEEVHACDTLPDILIGLPKVLPNTNLFAINLNRLTGRIPDWLLYHPKLDLWVPFSLVFMQEGKTVDGQSAGFSNEPASMDYYYDHYVNKVYNPKNFTEE